MTPKRLRLALVIPTLDQGGAEKQLALLASKLNRDLFETHVIALTRTGPMESVLKQAGIACHVIGKKGKIDPFAFLRLKKLMKSLQPDIVHTWLFAANAYGRLAASQLGIKVILGGERCVDPWKSWQELAIDRFLAKRSHGILTNSHAVREFYENRKVGVGKFHVINNGIDVDATIDVPRISREEACRRLGVKPDDFLIASVGRLWPQKGYRDLFWAIELVRVARPKAVYIVIGDGPLRQRLELYRDQLQIASNIRILGHRDDVQELMPHFDILLNGSEYEGQSNTIMEAMAHGIPVIASDIPGTSDLIVSQHSGILVPPKDTHRLATEIHNWLDNPEELSQLGKAGQLRMRNEFSVDRMVKAHEELYHRLWNS